MRIPEFFRTISSYLPSISSYLPSKETVFIFTLMTVLQAAKAQLGRCDNTAAPQLMVTDVSSMAEGDICSPPVINLHIANWVSRGCKQVQIAETLLQVINWAGGVQNFLHLISGNIIVGNVTGLLTEGARKGLMFFIDRVIISPIDAENVLFSDAMVTCGRYLTS